MFGLSFLYPAFLLGAAAVAVPILLHLLTHQTAPRLPFSSVRFLKQMPVEQSRRRLRELLLLAIRMTALLLLALAFARPYFTSASGLDSGAITMVAVDTSYSMSAPGQFERAQGLARAAVSAAPASQPVGVITFADTAELAVSPSQNRGDALRAIADLRPGFGGTHYGAALTRAAESIGSRPGRIVVVTDLQQSGWESQEDVQIPESIRVEVADAGAPVSNLAVTDIRHDADAVIVTVRNTGPRARTGRARLSIDGRISAESDFAVDPNVSSEVRFSPRLPKQGAVSVAVDDPEGYTSDNTRYLALDPQQPTPLLAVTSTGNTSREALYLERALATADDSGRFSWTAATAGNLGTMDDLERYGAVLLLSARGLERRGGDALQSYLTNGGGLLIAAGPDAELDVLQRTFGEQLQLRLSPGSADLLAFSPVDARHPVFRPFGAALGNLSRVEFRGTVLLRDVEDAEVIARFSNGAPALVDVPHGRGRVLLFASDLNREWNDFPLHPAYVPFVHEMARYLAAAHVSLRDYLVADAPAGVTRAPGVYMLQTKGAAGADASAAARGVQAHRVAVNVDPRESDPMKMTADQFVGSVRKVKDSEAPMAQAGAAQQEDRQRLWRFGLMAVMAGLVAEGALGRRL